MLMRAVPFVLLTLLLVGGCSSDDDDGVAEAPPELGLSFDGSSLVSDEGRGSEPVEVAAVEDFGGAIEPTESSDGSTAARFPAFAQDDPPLAVLTVRATGQDFLSPGTDEFAYGVDFSVDDESEGGVDNGNNLMQRGLFGEGAQYKLQLDHGNVSCRVTGSEEELVVEAPDAVTPDTWYRVRCAVGGKGLTVRVAKLDDGKPGDWKSATAEGDPGEVSFGDDVPVSVGGKISPEGQVVPSSPDQFNGALDNVYYARLS